jgi:hypothetical protein
MAKILLVIAGAALGLCLIFLAVAAGMGGLGLLNDTGHFADFVGDKPLASTDGTREWVWTGDSFKDEVATNVHYLPDAKGPPRIILRGPDDELDKIVFHNGELAKRRGMGWGHFDRVDVTLTGAVVRHFSFAGSAQLLLGAVSQDVLDVNVAGSGTLDAEAPGHVDELTLNIAGHGDDHLGKLIVQNAHIHIAGRGDIEIAPIEEAEIDIMGSGAIKLMTKPKSLSTHVMGAVTVTDADGNTIHDH